MVDKQDEINEEMRLRSLQIIDKSGNPTGNLELNNEWLIGAKGDQAVQDVIVACRAGIRQGSAATKNRANIQGSGSKPWRQKGTGRARSGTRKSPIWRGGGVIFGPTPRNYSKKVNAKVRKLALRRAFTSRIDEGAVVVVNELTLDEPKTKLMTEFLKAIDLGTDVLIILENMDHSNIALSVRNLPFVEVTEPKKVSVYQLLLHSKIIFSSSAINVFGTRLT